MKSQNYRFIRCCTLTQAVRAAVIGTSASVMLLGISPAHAQDTSGASSSQSTGSSQAAGGARAALQSKEKEIKNLSTVTVTAEKKSESEQNVPISMSVLEGDNLLNTGLTKLDDFYTTVPGLSMYDSGSGRQTLDIRGISAGSQMNPTVGISIDDAPFGSSTTDYSIADLDPFDVDHIEVLRGPQGTLYGASSMGGLIKYVMVQPDPGSGFSGRVQTDVSSTAHGGGGYGARAALNIPLIKDKLAIRASVFKRRDPGFVNDPQLHAKGVNWGYANGGRLSALWNASNNWTVRASVMAQNDYANATARVDMVGASYNPLYGPYDHNRLAGTDGSYIKVRIYTAQVDGKMDWADFHSISSYNQYSIVGPQDITTSFGQFADEIYGITNAGLAIENNLRTGKFTQEFRLSSPDDGRKFSWLVGAYFTNEHTTGYQAMVPEAFPSGENLGLGLLWTWLGNSTYKEKAAFGNVTYQFTDTFDVQVGGRFSQIDQGFGNYYNGPLNGGPSSDQEGAHQNVWTYSFSPRYHINNDLMVYARVATGYRAGGANALEPQDVGNYPEQFKSDSLTSYELGLKGDFLDHTMTFYTALFDIDWKNLQVYSTSQVTGASYTVNAASAKSQGTEATFSWRPIHGLEITSNASYTHAILTSNMPTGTYGEDGARLPFSPRWQGNVAATYTFPMSNSWEGYFGGNVSYIGNRYVNFANTAASPRFLLRAYTTAGLNVGVQNDLWNVSFYVKNLFDTRGYLSAVALDSTSGISNYGVLLIQPRTVGLSATYSF